MDDIGQQKPCFRPAIIVHIATVWGYDLAVNLRINRIEYEMLNYLDPERVKNHLFFDGSITKMWSRLLLDEDLPMIKIGRL